MKEINIVLMARFFIVEETVRLTSFKQFKNYEPLDS